MQIRKNILVLSLAAFAVPAAFAASGGSGSASMGTQVPGQASGKTRAEVRAEFDASRNTDPAKTGGSGSAWSGPYLIQHSYGFSNGKLVHTDNLSHDQPRASTAPTDTLAARNAQQDQLAW